LTLDGIFAIGNSGLAAQAARITLIAQNLANANSVEASTGEPYQRRLPIFTPAAIDETPGATAANGAAGGAGVRLAAVLTDTTPPQMVYDPTDPRADAAGMVAQPTVNPVYEMVDLMEASRSYQANLAVIQTAHTAALKTLDLLK